MTTPDTKLYVLTCADGYLGLIGPFDDVDVAEKAGLKWRQTAVGDDLWRSLVRFTDARVRSPLPLTAPEREPRVSWEVYNARGCHVTTFLTEEAAKRWISGQLGWTVVRMQEDLTYGKR